MDKNQSNGFSYQDEKYNSVNKSENDRQIEFPTNGNSSQFKIDGGYGNTLIPNRNSHYNNAFNNNSEDVGTIKVQIFLNIEFDLNGKIEMLKINPELSPTLMTIDSIITLAINLFNDILEERQAQHRINPNELIWNLYMSKKNGKPKQDLPALDRDNLLLDTQEDMFSLDTTNSDKLWDANDNKWIDYLIQKEDDENEAIYGQDNHKNDKHTENTSAINQKIQTEINQQIHTKNKNIVYTSQVAKQKHKQNLDTPVCHGLCSFSRK